MLNYNAPVDGQKSSIDGAGSDQRQTDFWLKKSIIKAADEQYFTPLANAINMPKHFGKKVTVHEYIPLLDDRNINDQGLDAAGAVIANGNLYGSSKDIGNILNKLPDLQEEGGRVNRVGFTRILREGSIRKFGFFTEFTNDALQFDSDEMLMEHISRELMTGATQMTEAALQIDLINAAGVEVYPGDATTPAEVTAEGADATVVDYETLMRLDRILTDNLTPKHTTMIKGSRLVDTRTVANCRVLYIGSELTSTLMGMRDLLDEGAFIPAHKYADAGSLLNGEIGSIGHFRIVEVPKMLNWTGAGATATVDNPGYRETAGKYDVFPMLVVGDDSFSTIGFQTDGKSWKFNVITKMPGNATADRNDPYGEQGFSSIKWFYGSLIKRPERIGLIRTVAKI